jgi:hypothetical protein
MRAIGVRLSERGARTDEYLAAMRSVWYDARPAFEGRFVRFSGIQSSPRPGPVPIVVGGHSPAAFRRRAGARLVRAAGAAPASRLASGDRASTRGWQGALNAAVEEDMGAVVPDPDRAYADWALHAERCPRCAGAGELAPDDLCPGGRRLLAAWLASEPAGSTPGRCRSRSFGDQMRINSELAPA